MMHEDGVSPRIHRRLKGRERRIDSADHLAHILAGSANLQSIQRVIDALIGLQLKP